ncbi:phosphate signaling complex protein PhoU [Lutibacter sp.]|uniref:phosphate signaling complex protein PhoU n=1 Tax=Lutibacter sp. TaxID=1925666 RepID=UPI0025C07BED|nr:phosphate signaling complex protein PhoU [Lutibacter sp.]MCF6181546.1 phosphate signaling complex protein PhoU [Lutibacter sp.]
MEKSIQYKDALNKSGLKMLSLCENQLINAYQAFSDFDTDLAEEVMRKENRINALDIKIEEDCEQYLALYKPVARDLRFIMAIRKINSDLERIGDHAYALARNITLRENPVDSKLMELLQVEKMFSVVMEMMQHISEGFIDKKSKTARKVFKKDKIVDEINTNSYSIITNEVTKNPKLIADSLVLFSVIHKLERVGDLIKNISEKIIFYLDAEIIMHKKTK